MVHGARLFEAQAHIFDHLTGVKFHYENTFHPFAQTLDGFRGERPQGYGTEKTYFDSLGAGILHGFLTYACHASECHYEVLCVFGLMLLPSWFEFLDVAVFFL